MPIKERLTNYCIKRLTGISRRLELVLQREKDILWNKQFKRSESYIHHFRGFQIKLYKDSILSRLIFDGFENQELYFLEKFLKEGDVFFDIGANIGLFSLTASKIIGESGKIFSFEPTPVTFQRLQENIKLNNLVMITALNVGLSHENSMLKLNISESGYDAWNSFATSEDEMFQKTALVGVTTLDAIVQEYGLEKIDLIKIDVEGWEKFVLQGGEGYFVENSPVVMVEFTEANTFAAGYYVQELYDLLTAWGYKWYRIVNNKLVLENKHHHYPYDNLIATKDINVIYQRCSSFQSS